MTITFMERYNTQMPPKVSVVMTVYNHPKFIPEAIESVLDQDHDSFELIVVDDGSAEDIPAILAPYATRLRYIRQDNTGLGPARDRGVSAAQGEYIAFCDSDDIHLPYRLSAHATLLDRFPEAAQVFSDLSIYKDGIVSCESTLRKRALGVDQQPFVQAIASAFPVPTRADALEVPLPEFLGNRLVYVGRIESLIASRHVAWGGASMFRRSMLRAVGPHDPKLRHWEDWSVVSRIAKRHPLIYLDAPVLLYRQHEGQQTKQAEQIGAKAYRDIVFRIWKNDAAFANSYPDLLSKMISRATLQNALCAAQNGEFARGRRELLRFIRNTPTDYRGYTALLRNITREAITRVRGPI